MQTNKDYFKVIQITDTHLFKNAESLMFGLSSNRNFDSVPVSRIMPIIKKRKWTQKKQQKF